TLELERLGEQSPLDHEGDPMMGDHAEVLEQVEHSHGAPGDRRCAHAHGQRARRIHGRAARELVEGLLAQPAGDGRARAGADHQRERERGGDRSCSPLQRDRGADDGEGAATFAGGSHRRTSATRRCSRRTRDGYAVTPNARKTGPSAGATATRAIARSDSASCCAAWSAIPGSVKSTTNATIGRWGGAASSSSRSRSDGRQRAAKKPTRVTLAARLSSEIVEPSRASVWNRPTAWPGSGPPA